MENLTINGVSFNVDAIKKLDRPTFVAHDMHEHHWIGLKELDRRSAINEAYDIIQSYGNTDSITAKGGADATIDIIDSQGVGTGNEGSVSKPQRRAISTRKGQE